MKLEYYEKWFRAKKQPLSFLPESEALERHNSGKPYIVFVSNTDGTYNVIDIAGDWVSVLFLDQNKRHYLNYDFKKKNNGRVFLSKAIHQQFEEGKDKCLESLTFIFEEDGSIYMVKRNMQSGELEEKEAYFEADENWDAYPSFGSYTTLLQEKIKWTIL